MAARGNETTTTTITVDATKSNVIYESAPNEEHGGGDYILSIGQVDGDVRRALLFFDVTSISASFSAVVKATLVLSVAPHYGSSILCTAAISNASTINSTAYTTGCPTVHLVTTEWGEGTNQMVMAEDGTVWMANGTGWKYSWYPTEWKTLGGDFEPAALGRRVPPNGDDDDESIATFPLHPAMVQSLLLGNINNYKGFMMRDDTNTGVFNFESRWCVNQSDGPNGCTQGMAPRLELTLEQMLPLSQVGGAPQSLEPQHHRNAFVLFTGLMAVSMVVAFLSIVRKRRRDESGKALLVSGTETEETTQMEKSSLHLSVLRPLT